MKRFMITPAVLALVMAGAACEHTSTVPQAPAFEISDGAHAGNPHFYWLPPMVPDPDPTGTFDATRSPVVLICEWDGIVCTNVIAEFTMLTGPGSETVRMVPEDEHYIVNWHTNEYDLDPALLYRITVSVDGIFLGSAALDVVSTGGELKNVDTGEFVALKDGTTLAIKFRIEEGAIATNLSPTASIDNPPGDVTVTLGDAVEFQGSASDPDGIVVAHSWDFGDGSVAAIEDPGAYTYAAAGVYPVRYFVTDDDGASSQPDMVVLTVQEPPNQPPTASIDNPPGNITITLGDAVDFQGSATDPDGAVVSHSWDFGDGNVAAVEDPGSHIYAATGVYTVTYFVTDDDGTSSTPDMVVVTVEEPSSFTASSVQLDGVDDVVDMATAHEIVSAEAFSLSIWYNAAVAGEGHLIGKQNPDFLRRGYFIHTDGSGNVCFSLVANENSLRQRECTTTPPTLGEWHHVVATVAQGARSFAAARIYVDGIEAATTAIGQNLDNSSFSNAGANFTIGAAGHPVTLSRAFQGWVDEAAIFRGLELTAAQVSEIYNDGSPPDLAALVMTPLPTGWWRMGECTDGAMTLVCDDGTGSAPGTLLNGAVFSTEVP